MSLREVGRGPTQDLVLLLEQLDPPVRLTQRIGLATGPVEVLVLEFRRSSTVSHRFRHDGEIPKSFAT
jgi:hypothetical protein